MDVLYSTVERAAGKLKADDLEEQLAALLKMDRTTAVKGEQGNACMVAALVLTVAVLVQTRLEAGKGLHNIDVKPLAEIGTSPRPAENLERAFNRILQHDYEPVFTIARDILCDVTQARAQDGDARRSHRRDHRAVAGRRRAVRDGRRGLRGGALQPHHARPGVGRRVLHAAGGRRAARGTGASRYRRDGFHEREDPRPPAGYSTLRAAAERCCRRGSRPSRTGRTTTAPRRRR